MYLQGDIDCSGSVHVYLYLQGDIDCVQALLEGSVDVNQPGNSGLTALHIACMCGHHEVNFG